MDLAALRRAWRRPGTPPPRLSRDLLRRDLAYTLHVTKDFDPGFSGTSGICDARGRNDLTGDPRKSLGGKKSHVGRCPTMSHNVPDQNSDRGHGVLRGRMDEVRYVCDNENGSGRSPEGTYRCRSRWGPAGRDPAYCGPGGRRAQGQRGCRDSATERPVANAQVHYEESGRWLTA